MSAATPIIGVTMGDPAGIGPEIVAKVFAAKDLHQAHRAIVVGDRAILEREAGALGLELRIRSITDPSEARFVRGSIDLIEASALSEAEPRGTVTARAGSAAFAYVRRAIELTLAQKIAGITTAPINKASLAAAGVPYPGHTEMLANLSGTRDYAMILANPHLRVILVTVHLSLAAAIAQITAERVFKTIVLADRALQGFGIKKPRIAVAGLNPHAGEGGLFGTEERDVIVPAIERARAAGITVSGPLPPDTAYMHAMKGAYDIVVSQYHDQGLIPIKLLGIENGVNLTAGLPFVRTSVDHGTAYDIAGRGIADPTSLRVALDMARDIARASSGMTRA